MDLDRSLDEMILDEPQQRSSRRGGRSPSHRGKPYDRQAGAAPGEPSNRVYVGNLSWQTSWQDLKDHFRVHGNVIRADALIGADGRPKGQGTVLFETAEEAQRAILATHDTDFQGRVINVHDDKYAR